MTKQICKIDDGNISTWTIFHLPPEQVTGKLNITPCVPQNYLTIQLHLRISEVLFLDALASLELVMRVRGVANFS